MKRLFKSSLAVLLAMLCVVYCLPQNVLAEIGILFDEKSEQDSFVSAMKPATVIGEMTETRTDMTKTFRMSDGSYLLVQYPEPVHFELDGKWEEYDNTLVLKEGKYGKYYTNLKSDIEVRLGVDAPECLLSVWKDGKGIGISPERMQAVSPKVEETKETIEASELSDYEQATILSNHGARIVYPELLKGVDFEYTVTGAKVKENIVVKERMEEYRFSFRLTTENLSAEMTEDGAILFLDEAGEISFVIPKGYLYDAKGNDSEAVKYLLEKDESGSTILTVIADSEWMNDSERAFPVWIDPTIETGAYLTSQVDDARTYLADPADVSGNDQYLMCGGASSTERYRLFVKMNILPEIPDSAVIVNATLNLRQLQRQGNWKDYNGNVDSLPFAAFKVTSAWNESTLCWNTMPNVDETVLDYRDVSDNRNSGLGKLYRWDITKAVEGWYKGESNNGIAIYPVNEYEAGGNYASTGFYSSENPNSYNHAEPIFSVSFRDQKGLEGAWTYVSQNADAAGTGYVNGFNGNLVFAHQDIGTIGGVLPVSVGHVFNSYQKGCEYSTDYPVGKGWKLTVQETFRPAENGNLPGWYVYTDSDGTELYFKDFDGEPTTLESEDGYDLVVTKNTSDHSYLMTDRNDNKKYFDQNGRLGYIEDVLGNRKQFVYSETGLTSVQYVSSAGTTETQLLFEYNGNGALKRISNGYDTNAYVTFYYSTGYQGSISANAAGYLRKIEYSNNGSVVYTCSYEYYADGLLKSAKDDETGYRIEYEYESAYSAIGTPFMRVKSVKEYGGSELGQTIGFTYASQKFTVRTSGEDDVYGNGDDLLTHYVFDHYGRAISSDSTDMGEETMYGAAAAGYAPYEEASKVNHRITSEIVAGMNQSNLLRNGGVESATGWQAANSGSGYTSTRTTSERLYGSYSYQLSSTTTGTGYRRVSQSVSIPSAGTYTLSAYVKTSGITGTGGAYLQLGGTASEKLTGTTNPEIQNGWQRISVTKTFTSAGSYVVEMRLANASGIAYFDCLQLEKSEVPSHYNFVGNGSMDASTGWSGGVYATNTERGNAILVSGDPDAYKYASQTIALNVPKGTTLMLSGWGKADSVRTGVMTEDITGKNKTFRLVANLLYTDGEREDQAADFNPQYTGWQYACAAIVPKKDLQSITLYLSYDFNANDAYFDDVALTIEPAQTYSYDENGNLNATVNENGNESLMSYAENGKDLVSYISIIGEQYHYEYKTVGSIETHLVERVTKTAGDAEQTLNYTYDSFGNVTEKTVSSGANEEGEIVRSIATYIENGNFLSSVTDTIGGTTNYVYDNAEKLLESVQNANGYRTHYVYDNGGRTSSVFVDRNGDGTANSSEEKVEYAYTNNRLTGISTATSNYTIVYDTFGNMTEVRAGEQVLVSYQYRLGNGKLLQTTDGNGNTESYVYDRLDRIVSVLYNGNVIKSVVYDANGQAAKINDHRAGIGHSYEYDSLGRLIRAWQKNTATGTKTLAVENLYDSYGRADKSTYVVSGRTLAYDLTYKNGTNLVSSLLMPESDFMSAINYTYDGLDRLVRKNVSFSTLQDLYEEYGYHTYTEGGTTYTTPLVDSLTFKQNGTTTATYSYTYDSLGNITEIRKNGSLTSRYEYDALNQLVREDDFAAGTATIFTYDKAGNISAKYVFPWVNAPTSHLLGCIGDPDMSTVSYNYSSTAWGDLLANYNGTAIGYDTIGNPTNWRNAVSLTWNGKLLTYAAIDWLDEGVAFGYNADGIRVSKTYWDENGRQSSHKYVLDGTNIIKETVGNDVLYYFYDAAGSVAGFEYNGTLYYYQKNLQGDIVRICDVNGTTVTEYTYDAWGKVLSVTGSLASTVGKVNPFRYRGYYYDAETGYYYLQTRYYDPEVGRFLNADAFIGANGDILGYNMFAYCSNNPVVGFDPCGMCYFNSNGEWCHDNWEYIGNYQRISDPSVYKEKTSTGKTVIVVNKNNYSAPKNVVIVVDSRNSKANPNVQIRDSYRIEIKKEKTEILSILLQFNEAVPSESPWKRSLPSMLCEWNAHNDLYKIAMIFSISEDDRCKHVDLDNNDEEMSYFDFYERAIKENLGIKVFN